MIFTFTHLADAFIQSELQCIQAIYLFFCQYVCSLGIEPTTFCAANTMLYHWATGTQYKASVYEARIKEKLWFSQCGRTWLVCRKQLNTSGVTLNADREPKIHHQTPMTHGIQSFHTLRNSCNRGGNTIFKYTNYVSIFVATVWKHPFLF